MPATEAIAGINQHEPTLCKLGIDLSAFDGRTPPEPIGLVIAGFDFFPDLQRQLDGMRRHFLRQ